MCIHIQFSVFTVLFCPPPPPSIPPFMRLCRLIVKRDGREECGRLGIASSTVAGSTGTCDTLAAWCVWLISATCQPQTAPCQGESSSMRTSADDTPLTCSTLSHLSLSCLPPRVAGIPHLCLLFRFVMLLSRLQLPPPPTPRPLLPAHSSTLFFFFFFFLFSFSSSSFFLLIPLCLRSQLRFPVFFSISVLSVGLSVCLILSLSLALFVWLSSSLCVSFVPVSHCLALDHLSLFCRWGCLSICLCVLKLPSYLCFLLHYHDLDVWFRIPRLFVVILFWWVSGSGSVRVSLIKELGNLTEHCFWSSVVC